jgi:hypothetical protein
VHDAVKAGLYASEDAVVSDALTKLKETLPRNTEPFAKKKAKSSKTSLQSSKKPMTEAEFNQHLLNIGLMSQLPNTDADFDDLDDEPITIKGEPLSETVIRERR